MITEEIEKIEESRYLNYRDEFDRYYDKTLYPFLQARENIRTKYVKQFTFMILMAVVFLPMFAVLIYFINRYFQKDIDWGIFYMLIAVALYVIRGPYANYRKEVKNDVMDEFFKFFDGFKYENGAGLQNSELSESRIFPLHDIATADDCFYGVYENVAIRVCEENLKRIVQTKKGAREVTVFQGIAVELSMNKKFSGQTIIIKDAGIFNVFKKFSDLENVKLEDVRFEKIFEVYSSDQVEARYILTPSFMERLLALLDLYKGKRVEASLYNDKILIAIETKQDMFEPCSFFKTNLNKKKFDTVFEQVWTVFSIINVLKLDQKIGL